MFLPEPQDLSSSPATQLERKNQLQGFSILSQVQLSLVSTPCPEKFHRKASSPVLQIQSQNVPDNCMFLALTELLACLPLQLLPECSFSVFFKVKKKKKTQKTSPCNNAFGAALGEVFLSRQLLHGLIQTVNLKFGQVEWSLSFYPITELSTDLHTCTKP